VVLLNMSAALWGGSFVLAKGLVARHDPLSVLAVRFAVAFAVMVAVRPGSVRALPRRTWPRAAALGAVYGAGQVLHYTGLVTTPASTAGFLVGMFLVVTPVLALLLLGRRSPALTWAGVLLGAVGLAVLSWHNTSFGLGEVLCLAAAVCYAAQIVGLGAWSAPGHSWGITAVQMGAIALVLAVPAGLRGWDPPSSGSDWLAIGYLAIVAGVLAVSIQTWAQTRLTSAHAAVIMAAEPLWAAAFAVLLTAEHVNARLVLGGTLLLAANVLTSVTQRRQARRQAAAAPPQPV
jgi:drug/metabolite transporter (DMT)-like permease